MVQYGRIIWEAENHISSSGFAGDVEICFDQCAFGLSKIADTRIRNLLQDVVSPCKQRTPKNGLTYARQKQKNVSPDDPSLSKLMEGWSQLSDEMRKAIIKMTS